MRLRMVRELPPRARRIHRLPAGRAPRTGTTSACAENTDFLDSAGDVGGNYLRVRGEYTCHACARAREWELPPRARRIHNVFLRCQCNPGTTSACAENTQCIFALSMQPRNYLRVRGEYAFQTILTIRVQELPPRARRILAKVMNWLDEKGTTSACAENTHTPPS